MSKIAVASSVRPDIPSVEAQTQAFSSTSIQAPPSSITDPLPSEAPPLLDHHHLLPPPDLKQSRPHSGSNVSASSVSASSVSSASSASTLDSELSNGPSDKQIIEEALRFTHNRAPPAYSPSSSIPTLGKPVALPQVTNGAGAPYARLYAPALLEYGITAEDFMSFVDGLNVVSTGNPALEILGMAGGIVSMVPINYAMIAGTAAQVAAMVGIRAVSKVRSDRYLRRANDEFFRPRGLEVAVCTPDALAAVAGMPRDHRLVGPLSYESLDASVSDRLLEAVQPYVSPLSKHVPARSEQTTWLAKLCDKQVAFHVRRNEKSARKSRLKALRKSGPETAAPRPGAAGVLQEQQIVAAAAEAAAIENGRHHKKSKKERKQEQQQQQRQRHNDLAPRDRYAESMRWIDDEARKANARADRRIAKAQAKGRTDRVYKAERRRDERLASLQLEAAREEELRVETAGMATQISKVGRTGASGENGGNVVMMGGSGGPIGGAYLQQRGKKGKKDKEAKKAAKMKWLLIRPYDSANSGVSA